MWLSKRNLIQKLARILFTLVERYPQNCIELGADGFIDESATISSAKILGNIKIEENAKIVGGVTIVANSRISIGRYSSINGPNTIINSSQNPVSIGNFCSIANNVLIQEYNHPTNKLTTYSIKKNLFHEEEFADYVSKGPIEIGHDVWIGSQSIILSGVKIGIGAIVAANSLVNCEIPSYAVVAGSPAKIVKYRFSGDFINQILELKWWEWPIEKIIKNKELFYSELSLNQLANYRRQS